MGEAKEALGREPPDYIVASVHLRDGIKALRKIGDTQEQVETLHLRLLEYEERSMGDMSHFEFELPDLTSEADDARQQVAGQSLPEALTRSAHQERSSA